MALVRRAKEAAMALEASSTARAEMATLAVALRVEKLEGAVAGRHLHEGEGSHEIAGSLTGELRSESLPAALHSDFDDGGFHAPNAFDAPPADDQFVDEVQLEARLRREVAEIVLEEFLKVGLVFRR